MYGSGDTVVFNAVWHDANNGPEAFFIVSASTPGVENLEPASLLPPCYWFGWSCSDSAVQYEGVDTSRHLG